MASQVPVITAYKVVVPSVSRKRVNEIAAVSSRSPARRKVKARQAFEGEGQGSLVHTSCACAEFSRDVNSHVHGKALRMKYTEIH